MSSDPFLDQLAGLCRAEPTRAKWVFVPAHRVGLTLGDRLVREGCDWANLRFVTPLDIAIRMAAPFLFAARLAPLPEGLGPSLVMRLLLELPPGTPRYFQPLADQPRMGAALWATMAELRLAGVTAESLLAASFDDARKHSELRALLAAYEGHLVASGQADAADVYRAAARVSAAPVLAADLVVEAPLLAAPPLVRAFLDALPGEHVACAMPAVSGFEIPRRRAAASRGGDAAHTDEDTRATWGGLELFHAAGREAEVEAVLRRILAPASGPARLDAVEVACASSEYAHLFWEKAQRLELPITVEQGVPVTTTRPSRALLGLCDWVESNFVAGRLRRLFEAGDLRIELPDGTGAGQAARLLSRAEATWGRDTYDASLAAFASRNRTSVAEDEDLDQAQQADCTARAARADALREWIHELLALVPAADARGEVGIADLVTGLLAFLDDRVAVSSPFDAAAVTVMKKALADLRALGDLRRPVRQAFAFIREAVDGLAVAASRGLPGHLHVCALSSAGLAGRAFTFIVGLEEGGVFPSLIEDPVLLDAERQRVSTSLPTSHDRLQEAVHAVLTRLAVLPHAAPGGVCASYSCRDLREGRPTFPSWLMLHLLRRTSGNAALTYDDLQARLGTPETLVPPGADRALTDAAWWLATIREASGTADAAVLEAFPSLAEGRKATSARESDRFTEWDGFVGQARALLDPRVSGEPISVTRLERLVSCPYRYFVEHGLGLDVTDDDDPDQDEWLDPLQRGSALHQVYAALSREARGRGRRLDPKRDLTRARTVAEETLDQLRKACPPPSDVVFDRERAEFLRDVDLFLEFEADREPSEPVAFEVSFGREPDGQETLAQAEPVAIPLGHGQRFLLRGTIDRIDRLPDGSYEVIDYKTGRFKRDEYRGTFRGSALLQHALYGVAATALLRRLEATPRVARGVYEFPSARGGGERVEIRPPGSAAIAAVLSDLFDVMADGAFISAQGKEACRYCDFSRACGEPIEQAKQKLENATNTRLDAYRKVTRHE